QRSRRQRERSADAAFVLAKGDDTTADAAGLSQKAAVGPDARQVATERRAAFADQGSLQRRERGTSHLSQRAPAAHELEVRHVTGRDERLRRRARGGGVAAAERLAHGS